MLTLKTGVMYPQAKECQQSREAGESKKQILSQCFQRKHSSVDAFIFSSDTDLYFNNSYTTMSEHISVVLSHLICGNLSQQSQETNTPLLSAALLKTFFLSPSCMKRVILFCSLTHIRYKPTVCQDLGINMKDRQCLYSERVCITVGQRWAG